MWQQLKNKGGYDNNIMIAGSKEISQVISQQFDAKVKVDTER